MAMATREQLNGSHGSVHTRMRKVRCPQSHVPSPASLPNQKFKPFNLLPVPCSVSVTVSLVKPIFFKEVFTMKCLRHKKI